MQMTDSRRIPASRETVWAALNDPDMLRQCIPGCESLEKISPTEMSAVVVLKVGPVKARFNGKVTLSDIDPPNGYRITGEGAGGGTGFAKGGAAVRLESEGPEATVLHYDVEAQVGGKIAQLGARLIDSTARKLAGEFFEKFAAAVAPSPAAAEPAEREARQDAGKGWLKGIFSRSGTAASAVAVVAAAALFAHLCCFGSASAQAPMHEAFPICRGGPAT